MGAPHLAQQGARAPSERSRLERLTSVDHPDRSSPFPTRPVAPTFLRVDHTHELPLVALDELGRELARFRRLADLAFFLCPSGSKPTLPAPIAAEARAAHVSADPLWRSL